MWSELLSASSGHPRQRQLMAQPSTTEAEHPEGCEARPARQLDEDPSRAVWLIVRRSPTPLSAPAKGCACGSARWAVGRELRRLQYRPGSA
jgi:hypothetical protein